MYYLHPDHTRIKTVLHEFSIAWCKCNPAHPQFGSLGRRETAVSSAGMPATAEVQVEAEKEVDAVYALCYAILVLNTDAHSNKIPAHCKMDRVSPCTPAPNHMKSETPQSSF
jgi:Sec7-like guanine-nucleotide exchange factor